MKDGSSGEERRKRMQREVEIRGNPPNVNSKT
jgi:hypothetical protein